MSFLTGIVGGLTGGLFGGGGDEDSAGEMQAQLSREQTAFAREQYDYWKSIYGPLQDSMAMYYSNLNPEYYAQVGVDQATAAHVGAMQSMQRRLQQQGIEDSEVLGSLEEQSALSLAQQKAALRRAAPSQVATEQQAFLSVGLKQNPANAYQNVMQSQASAAGRLAEIAGQAQGQAASSAITTIGTGLEAYFNRNK